MTLLISQNRKSLYSVSLISVTLFTSAFLLFWAELFSAKLILPQLGGSPAVWTTCLLFFQVLLLLGYVTSNWLSSIPILYQVSIQIALLLSGFCELPVTLKLKAVDFSQFPEPVVVLLLLSLSIGLPFLALAGLSPLLQHWYKQVDVSTNPYSFYAASNSGSLAALILYPLWIEPHLGLMSQGKLWAFLYASMAGLVTLCGIWVFNHACSILQPAVQDEETLPSWKDCRNWVLLAFTVSSLLSATTVYASEKIAPFPLLWAFFLGLYLLSMILVFAPAPQYIPNWLLALICPIVAVALIAEFLPETSASSVLALVKLNAVWIGFFLIAWACHGQIAQSKPPPAYLTQFYLWIALGGALGGAFNALLVPILFRAGREFEITVLLSLILLPKVIGRIWNLVSWSGLVGLAFAAALISNGVYPFTSSHSTVAVAIDRSFFGSYAITDDTIKNARYLRHGITLHGVEFLAPNDRDVPLSYFSRTGPLGDVFKLIAPPARVGVIGLGSGTIAAYAQPGEAWKFYEIDPLIVRFAQQHFWFLRDAQAPVTIQTGDARIELERSSDCYDLLIIDAFTGDSIPQHLMTQEAIKLYLDHLNPGGVLAFHITNNYLHLAPVIGRIAQSLNLNGLMRSDWIPGKIQEETEARPSQWAVLSLSLDQLKQLPQQNWQQLPVGKVLWTDDFSSLVTAL